MRLPDFLENGTLNALRLAMGAHELGRVEMAPNRARLTLAELEELITGGIDIQSLDEIRALPDGTLAYKDRRVLLYIRDVAQYGSRRRGIESLPKFHVANCKKLQDMRAQQRFARYVVAARQDGSFQINRVKSGASTQTSTERLNICQYCLGDLGLDGFSRAWSSDQRKNFVRAFTVDRFFAEYARDLIDSEGLGDEATTPLNDYSGDFGDHAAAAKDRADYQCDSCKRSLKAPPLRRFLHAHHVNAVKWDNSAKNLKALCIACHAEQPHHSHMKSLPDYKRYQSLTR